jgi:two-component system, LytTR family, sensor kinase
LLWLLLTLFLLYFVYDETAPVLAQFVAVLLVTGLTSFPAFISVKKLVPGYLYTRKTGKFISFLLLISILNTILTYVLAGILYYGLSGKSIFSKGAAIAYIFSFFFIANLIVITVSSAVKIIMDRFGIEEQLHEVEHEKMLTELAFLRAQINPHFLFNVLNTIYFQIKRENEPARNLVEKLSGMLRYQLYECTTDRIDIAKELAYIENYVAVQKMRMEPGTDLQMKVQVGLGSFLIAPLLILTLVENGFKHISHFQDPKENKVHIQFTKEPADWFVISVSNSCNPEEEAVNGKKSGGVGLINLERRLELLYPGRYSFTRTRNKNSYETILKIRIND